MKKWSDWVDDWWRGHFSVAVWWPCLGRGALGGAIALFSEFRIWQQGGSVSTVFACHGYCTTVMFTVYMFAWFTDTLFLVYAAAASLLKPMISRPLTSIGRPWMLEACDWLLPQLMSASHESFQYPPLAQTKTTHRIARRSQLSGTVLGTDGLRHAVR